MIGIFDSGLGGTTVFKEIIKELPNYSYIYYSDSLNNPYGDKSSEELKKITFSIVKYLVNRGCKVIVIACNTASAICKDYLRLKFSVPIIAIEPSIKPIYDNKKAGDTLLIATKGTIESLKFKELYQKYNNGKIYLKKCPGLADLIEENDKDKIKKYIIDNLGKYKGVENVVLGCTHYPLIIKELKEVLGDVNIYQGSIGVVKELKRIIKDIKLEESTFNIEFIDTKNDLEKEKRFWELLH